MSKHELLQPKINKLRKLIEKDDRGPMSCGAIIESAVKDLEKLPERLGGGGKLEEKIPDILNSLEEAIKYLLFYAKSFSFYTEIQPWGSCFCRACRASFNSTCDSSPTPIHGSNDLQRVGPQNLVKHEENCIIPRLEVFLEKTKGYQLDEKNEEIAGIILRNWY